MQAGGQTVSDRQADWQTESPVPFLFDNNHFQSLKESFFYSLNVSFCYMSGNSKKIIKNTISSQHLCNYFNNKNTISRAGVRKRAMDLVNIGCWLLFRVCSTFDVLPQWLVKDLVHSAKSAGGRLHLNMHISLTQWSQSGLTMLSHYGLILAKRWNLCAWANLRLKTNKQISAGGE